MPQYAAKTYFVNLKKNYEEATKCTKIIEGNQDGKILFICHGNTAARWRKVYYEGDGSREAGLTSAIQIDSAAVSREEIGNPIYPSCAAALRRTACRLTITGRGR